jgi:peptide/nickel transport system substrate-binding protein
MPSEESRTLAFLSGDIDSMKGPFDQAWVEEMKASGKVVDILGPGFAGTFMFKLTKPPLDNWLVRAAIAHAISREEIADVVGRDIASPQPSVVPEGWVFGTYENIPRYKYDPELAKKLLKIAGYPNGFKLESFVSGRSYYANQFEVIQAQLKRVGIDLLLKTVDHPTFHANQRKDLNDLILFGNGGWNAEAHLISFWLADSIITKPSGNLNYSHYGDVGGSIDDLYEAALGQDEQVKAALYAAAQRRILTDLGGYPTIWMKIPVARQPYVDLGYQPKFTYTGSWYTLPWNAKILKH